MTKMGTLFLLLILTVSVSDQNTGKRSYLRNNPIKKNPAIGLGAGGTYFLGDMGSAEVGVIRPAVNFKTDYRLSRSFGVEINLVGGFLAQKYDGVNYMLYDFEAFFGHGTVNVRYHLDNIFNLKPHALVSPYLTTGFGFMVFESFYDHYDSEGDPYIILEDGTIVNESGEPVSRNDKFETPVNPDNEYPNNASLLPVGAGVKLQFSEHFEMNVEGMMYLTNHDYIEGYLGYTEVAEGSWERNDPNEANDAYIYASITFMYSFGYNPDRRAKRIVPRVKPSY
ncbi:MAG: hypothetical protein R6U19_01025 [Bacteroidales bacterium]